MVEKKVILSHSISPDDKDFLNAECDREKVNRSEIVRRAIALYRQAGQRKARRAVKMLA